MAERACPSSHHPLSHQSLTCHMSEFQKAAMALQPISSCWDTGSQDGEGLQMLLVDHMHPKRAPLRRVHSGQQRSAWVTCLTYPSCRQIRGSPDQLYLHGTWRGGRDTTALHCKCIKRRWIGREPGGSFMLIHTRPGRSEGCS